MLIELFAAIGTDAIKLGSTKVPLRNLVKEN